ncbi:MAG: 3-phosphoshikimate 1-carboxyvinyltransferase, partial [Acidimicrobiia bacterium]
MSVRKIQRVDGPIEATVSLPGSKSETIRALACAAMAEGRSHLYGALHAEDTSAMVGGLMALGVAVQTDHEPWVVDGTGGHLVASNEPVVVGESGLSARILTVMATLAEGVTTIDGIGRLRQRPMAGLIKALTDQGVAISATNHGLPVTVTGQG